MYRDSATLLDERDGAVGAILIGEALVGACDRGADRARASNVPLGERWRAVADTSDAYPEIWRYLDRARRVLASRGANTIKYDELRPRAPRAATASDDVVEPSIDRAALDEAKRAIGELKLALPGADWDAIEQRTQGLVRLPLSRRRRNRLALAGVLVGFACIVATWLVGMVPQHRPDRGEDLRRELAAISLQRAVRIDQLVASAPGATCDTPRAQELARLFAQDGRGDAARWFARFYETNCGGDPIVAKWANAPRQHHRR